MEVKDSHRMRGRRAACGVPRVFIAPDQQRSRWATTTCPGCLAAQGEHEPFVAGDPVHLAVPEALRPSQWQGEGTLAPFVGVTACGIIAPGGAVSVELRDVSCPACVEAATTMSPAEVNRPRTTYHVVQGAEVYRLVVLSTPDRDEAVEMFSSVDHRVPTSLYESITYPDAGEGPWEVLMEVGR